MVTDSTKKFRDVFALVLLGIVLLELIVAFSLLFKDLGGAGFSDKSVILSGDFVRPVNAVLVVVAVVVTTHLGPPTKLAHVVTIAGAALLGVLFVLGVVTWIAALTSDSVEGLAQIGSGFAGVVLAGKVTGTFALLGYLALTGLATFFSVITLMALPRPAKARQQPQQGGWGQQPQYGGWGQQPQQGGWGQQPQQGGWGQTGQASAWASSGWGRPETAEQPQQDPWVRQPQHGSWAQPGTSEQSWGQPETAEHPWGQPEAAEQPQQDPWVRKPQQDPWGQQHGSWAQPGTSEQSWGQPETAEQPQQDPWGQSEAAEQPQQDPWGQSEAAEQPQQDPWGQSAPYGAPSDESAQAQETTRFSAVSAEEPARAGGFEAAPEYAGSEYAGSVYSGSEDLGFEETGSGDTGSGDSGWGAETSAADGSEAGGQPADESSAALRDAGVGTAEGDAADAGQSEDDDEPGWWNPGNR